RARGTVLGVSSDAPRGGRTALLRAGGTTIAIASRRMAFTLRRDFADLGLDPANFDLTVVKLGYLFPELREIARAVYMALTPGASDLDIPRLPFRRICRPIFPLDPEMTCPEFEVRVIPD
ncbi:MAG: MlrC C-terminal domain-containing protein, partial [Thermomicrobiales bacterium]|nr:MlrC C-terminal domain-containing protein [Thermomicrobiales bacterium]